MLQWRASLSSIPSCPVSKREIPRNWRASASWLGQLSMAFLSHFPPENMDFSLIQKKENLQASPQRNISKSLNGFLLSNSDPLARALNEFPLILWTSSLNGVLLICMFLGSLNDVAMARPSAVGLEFSSIERQAEDQMEPSKGNCAMCIGVVDETLGACGAASNCVSTFDDRPAFFIAPWEFPGKLSAAVQKMQRVLVEEEGNIVEEADRYIHAVFMDKDGTVDDVEFLFSIPSEDATVNIRSASRRLSENDYGRNQQRLQRIRQSLMWEELPVLRNRSRKLFFLESPWDTFGPEPPPSFDYEGKLDFVPD